MPRLHYHGGTTMAMFGDANLQSQYDNIRSQLQGSGAYTPLSLPEQTLDGIAEQLAQIYRPQVERAIAQRSGATKQQKAAIDVDAGSRGMGTSTWVTDAKNRLMSAEAADIAGMESDYASQLAGDALTQYQNYLSDKLRLDQYNQQLQAAMEGAAYDQAMQQYANGLVEGTLPYQQLQFQWQQTKNAASGGGGGSSKPTVTLEDIDKYLDEKYGGVPTVTENAAKGVSGGGYLPRSTKANMVK